MRWWSNGYDSSLPSSVSGFETIFSAHAQKLDQNRAFPTEKMTKVPAGALFFEQANI